MDFCYECDHPATDHKGSGKPEPPGLREFRRHDLLGVCKLTYAEVMAQPYPDAPKNKDEWAGEVDRYHESQLNRKLSDFHLAQVHAAVADALIATCTFTFKGGRIELGSGPDWARKVIEADKGVLFAVHTKVKA